MVDVSAIYPDQPSAIAALQNMYCYGTFFSSTPAFLFSALYDHLVAGDQLYVLSGSAYVPAQPGFYNVYPFTGSGTESIIQIDSLGKYVSTAVGVGISCDNPGDFNSDFGSDFNN